MTVSIHPSIHPLSIYLYTCLSLSLSHVLSLSPSLRVCVYTAVTSSWIILHSITIIMDMYSDGFKIAYKMDSV